MPGGVWPAASTDAGADGAKAAEAPAADGVRKNSFGRNDSANSADSNTQRMLPPRLPRAAPSSISETEALDVGEPAPGACDEDADADSGLPVDAKIGEACGWRRRHSVAALRRVKRVFTTMLVCNTESRRSGRAQTDVLVWDRALCTGCLSTLKQLHTYSYAVSGSIRSFVLRQVPVGCEAAVHIVVVEHITLMHVRRMQRPDPWH